MPESIIVTRALRKVFSGGAPAAPKRRGATPSVVAIEFGLVAVASILQNVILEEEPLHRLPMTEHLHDELVRLFLRYLGINEG